MEACLTVLRGRDDLPAETPSEPADVPDVFRMPEALLRIRALVAAMTVPQPLEAFWPEVPEQKPEAAGHRPLRGGVDVRRGVGTGRESVVGLDQDEDFGAIMVSPRGIDTLDGIRASVEQGRAEPAARVGR